MLNKKLLLVFFCVFLSIMLISVGCRRHASVEDKMDRMLHYLTDDLNLTADQDTFLQSFKFDMIERINKIKSLHKAVRNEVREQLKSDVMDQDKLKTEVSFVRSEIDETITFVISSLAEFHQTLTKEQKELLVKKIDELKKLHGCD